MKHILISVLIILVFSWPALADDQFALVCDWKQSTSLKSGTSFDTSGTTIIVFTENENKIEPKSLTGLSCHKFTKYQATEFYISLECEGIFEGGIRTLHSIYINRFSGEVIDKFTTLKDGIKEDGGLETTGICKKETKRF